MKTCLLGKRHSNFTGKRIREWMMLWIMIDQSLVVKISFLLERKNRPKQSAETLRIA